MSNEPPEKVAIVTGASQGIGAGIARAYRELGYSVIATARSIESSADSGMVAVAGDITDPIPPSASWTRRSGALATSTL